MGKKQQSKSTNDLKKVKEEENLAQNVYHNCYYLIVNQHLLQKIIFVFKDVFLCLL